MNGTHEPSGIAFRARHASASGRPILFIHGAGGNKLVWLSLTRALAELLPDRPLYLIDLPGHGDSPKRGRDRIEDYAADLKFFIEQTLPPPVDLVGHSMGGAVSLTFALTYPERVRHVAVLGSGYRLGVSPAITEALRTDFPAAMSMVKDFGFSPDADPREVEATLAGLLACPPQTAIGDFEACGVYDVKDRIASLIPPLAVYYGTADVLTSENRNKSLADAVPGAVSHRFEGAGHMLMIERTAELAPMMAEFFA